MKKLILVLLPVLFLSLAWNHSKADTYAGIYGVTTNDITNNAGDYDPGNVNIVFGQSMDSNIGLGYEAFYNNAGLGGSVNMFTTINNKYKVSLGAILVPENTRLYLDPNFPQSSSSDTGNGYFVGFSTKLSGNKYINLKYIRYDANHSYSSTKCTANCGTPLQINTTLTGSGDAEREQLWLGITFHL